MDQTTWLAIKILLILENSLTKFIKKTCESEQDKSSTFKNFNHVTNTVINDLHTVIDKNQVSFYLFIMIFKKNESIKPANDSLNQLLRDLIDHIIDDVCANLINSNQFNLVEPMDLIVDEVG